MIVRKVQRVVENLGARNLWALLILLSVTTTTIVGIRYVSGLGDLHIRRNFGFIGVSLFAFLFPLPLQVRRAHWGWQDVVLFITQAITTMAFIMLCYAAIFSMEGLISGTGYHWEPRGTITGVPTITHDRMESLYFSAITWTTIGYGDLLPTPGACRFIAASEGLIQIIYLGTFVSMLFHLFQRMEFRGKFPPRVM